MYLGKSQPRIGRGTDSIRRELQRSRLQVFEFDADGAEGVSDSELFISRICSIQNFCESLRPLLRPADQQESPNPSIEIVETLSEIPPMLL